jgi:nucleoside-diphosphate-sugar epimerase
MLSVPICTPPRSAIVRKAIITGATGLVGSAVAKHLAARGVEVLCLGRKQLTETEAAAVIGSENTRYLAIGMETIQTLADAMDQIHWNPGDSCVFYHFAWSGREKLIDGNFRDQFVNAIYTANAVAAAKHAGCIKFVSAGTMEETFAELYLAGRTQLSSYESSQANYTIAKLAARDMSKIVAYLEKIDYIHTRLSVPLDEFLVRGGYVCSTTRKILRREPYQMPLNGQLFDIIITQDVAEAYFRLGQRGKNKADYFIGTSRPKTLREYFEICERIRDGDLSFPADSGKGCAANDLFSIQRLVDDTGFVPSISYENFVRSLV